MTVAAGLDHASDLQSRCQCHWQGSEPESDTRAATGVGWGGGRDMGVHLAALDDVGGQRDPAPRVAQRRAVRDLHRLPHPARLTPTPLPPSDSLAASSGRPDSLLLARWLALTPCQLARSQPTPQMEMEGG